MQEVYTGVNPCSLGLLGLPGCGAVEHKRRFGGTRSTASTPPTGRCTFCDNMVNRLCIPCAALTPVQ
jgi:hypothetical protein